MISGIDADGISTSEVTLHHRPESSLLPLDPFMSCMDVSTLPHRRWDRYYELPQDSSKCLSSCANITADNNAEHCVKPGYTSAEYIKSTRQNLAVLGCAMSKNMFYLKNPIKLGAKFVLHDELM